MSAHFRAGIVGQLGAERATQQGGQADDKKGPAEVHQMRVGMSG